MRVWLWRGGEGCHTKGPCCPTLRMNTHISHERIIEWIVAFAILEPVYDKELIEKIVKRLEFGVPSSHRQVATNGASMNREKIAKKVSCTQHFLACMGVFSHNTEQALADTASGWCECGQGFLMNCQCADFLLRCCCAHFVAWMVTHDLMCVPKVFDCTPITTKNGRPRTYGKVPRAPHPAGSIFVHQHLQ